MVPQTDPSINLDGRGILDFDGPSATPIANPFDGYSRIFVPYCSSDRWSGMGEITQVDRYQDPNGDGILDDLFPLVNGDQPDQAAGVVNVQVGFAPVYPAEFVVITISQRTASSS
jgi:hypothetical protein